MSVTTKYGYRRSRVAKNYQADVLAKTGVKINLRQARLETESIEKLIKTLKPFTHRERYKIIKAINILMDIE